MNTLKKLIGIYEPGSTHWVGDGFHVRNLFPSNGLQNEVSPFLMFDYAGPTEFKPSERPHGVDEHPHRGFETVTIAYQGSVHHRDSAGNSGTIHPGDVQWMTAASGVVHEEKHEADFARAGGIFEMAQLWVNLPRAYKMSEPRYQQLDKAAIPVVEQNGAKARIIAGVWGDVKGPAKTFTALNVFDLDLPAGTALDIPVASGQNASLSLLKGKVSLNDSDTMQGEAKIAVFERNGDSIRVEATEPSRLLLLSGEPIDEPVESYGPFVMNTREELEQAVNDYRAGRMGHLS